MRKRTMKRAALFLAIFALTAHVLVAGAQPKKRGVVARPKPRPKPAAIVDAGAAPAAEPAREAGAPVKAPKEPKEAKDSAKGADAGSRVFRFGEVEVEGRLKSPQIVYFLRRVRAEFAAGDLGHRSFMLELKDTRNDPPF